jgi:hypothetical protein
MKKIREVHKFEIDEVLKNACESHNTQQKFV